ncbi:hypothetical protein [Saccharibacillus sp. O23]|uniref:hypothetical protein n=1 Tax=Saccharibacillus sp. O23 TaxID=2009338 RepID=UPI00117BD8AD|nr:hypothetical protein [Saccharibacillus sp. O23]
MLPSTWGTGNRGRKPDGPVKFSVSALLRFFLFNRFAVEYIRNNDIQCAGSYESLIVEIRVPHENGFRHYAIGHEPSRTDWTEQEQAENERFDAEEAATLFFAFLDTRDVPLSFAKRDMSDMFA